MDRLNDMALFVEVVKANSFRGAAQAMNMPNSTLSRRISGLEKAIGLRLLHRTTRKVELTEAGRTYYERSRRIVEEARLAHEQLGDMLAHPSGTLRVSLPVDFTMTFLAPQLAAFARLYPGIDFDLDLTPRRVDLVSEPYDVAIRMGDQPDSGLIARRLALLPGYLYASPGYLDARGGPRDPSNLEAHEFLRMRGAQGDRLTLHSARKTVEVAIGGRVRLNSVGMLRRLATLDMGLAVLAAEIAAEDVADGRLVRVLPEWEATPMPVYAVTETRLLPARTQRFIEFLQDSLKRPPVQAPDHAT